MMYHHTSSLILEHITLESEWKGKCDWLSHYTHTHTQTYVLSISVTFLVNWLDSNVQCAIVDSDINQIFGSHIMTMALILFYISSTNRGS